MFESVGAGLVLFLHIGFESRHKQIGGYVAVLMNVPSLDELRSLIADFVKSITWLGNAQQYPPGAVGRAYVFGSQTAESV